MSMKQEIETWVSALSHYDNNEFEDSINSFQPIADTSKILFNCGVIKATLGEHETAVQYYERATSFDQYLAVAYFQQGVSNFLLGDFEEALANFNDTLLYLRGNRWIDYEQLGLKFKLYSCEVLFNRGLCYIYLQATEPGMQDLEYAAKEREVPDHDVIEEAIKEKAEGYTVFSIPVGVVFRPSEAKVKNVRARDYLGKARLVAQYEPGQRMNVSHETWARDDRPPEQLSYAATTLVRPNMRSRQQSEPPVHRSMFPPTPPPENEKPHARQPSQSSVAAPRRSSPDRPDPSQRARSASRPRPAQLDLGIAAFDKQKPREEPRRRAPPRSASERPAERRPDDRGHDAADARNFQYKPSRENGLFGAVGDDFDPNRPSESRDSASNRTRRPSRGNNLPRHSGHAQPSMAIAEEDEDDVIIDSPQEASSTSTSATRLPLRASSRAPQAMRKIRVKVHFGEDTRYVMTAADVQFAELLDAIKRKFALQSNPKMRIKDEEGDLITMGDQEDLDMAISMCKDTAAKEGADMGKLEVWAQEVLPSPI